MARGPSGATIRRSRWSGEGGGTPAGSGGFPVAGGLTPEAAGDPPPVALLDLTGEVCPYTFLKAKLALEEMPSGALLRVLVGDEASARDVPRSLARAGHAVLAVEPREGPSWAILVRKTG